MSPFIYTSKSNQIPNNKSCKIICLHARLFCSCGFRTWNIKSNATKHHLSWLCACLDRRNRRTNETRAWFCSPFRIWMWHFPTRFGRGKANLNCWDGPKTFFAAEMSRLQLTSVTCSNPLASLYYSWNTQETQELLWPGCVHKLTTCYLLLLNILQTTFRGAEFIPSSFIWLHTGCILYHVYIICILVQLPRQTSHICPARPCTLTSEKRISCCRLPWWPWPGWQPPSFGGIMIYHDHSHTWSGKRKNMFGYVNGDSRILI